MSRPVLVIHSLWKQACMRLLDIDSSPSGSSSSGSSYSGSSSSGSSSSPIDSTSTSFSTSTATTSLSPSSVSTSTSPPNIQNSQKTWDQKFFSQVDMSESGRIAVQDMMLSVLRIAVRCLLSRDDTESVDVAIDGKLFYYFIYLFQY